ncbi:MAG: prepilin-type N-terminal cleavage/methylation domain-containing protein [Sulfuricurvum sp.]|uniref:type II secretion system protein n=1 Tax=Sulfuricurvum sp. TaxID=2025608 RepID=UPI002622C0BB|nr:prepilin-type N-terminal cleavage/methylation domain-containing protein [Sulfuricurvum sp.]MDD2828573.1 prepilin-type N-terminal cleavage/methylation domain-containing protein [Sulfuricurvum sp.]MDD4948250.1 prepilin-type N-terminal cleavage/methylation domain-containing protein [Sulfuricurvum sp.]
MIRRTAFTMIELVFVIVVLGILAAIAVPRLAATRDDAMIAKGKSDVSAIRAAIVSERQSRLLKGESNYISKLDGKTTGVIFDGNDSTHSLLQYGITPESGKDGKWSGSNNSYTYQILGSGVAFTYTPATGLFDCDHTDSNCALLVQ